MANTELRAGIVAEARSWIGTPFRDCSDIKGPNGAVDCAMLLTRIYVDTGIVHPFNPRPYQPRHMMRAGAEDFFLGWIERCGGIEVASAEPGDVALYQFGHCFSHGAVVLDEQCILHAYAAEGNVTISRRDTPLLCFINWRRQLIPRPVKYFSIIHGGAPCLIPAG